MEDRRAVRAELRNKQEVLLRDTGVRVDMSLVRAFRETKSVTGRSREPEEMGRASVKREGSVNRAAADLAKWWPTTTLIRAEWTVSQRP